MDTGSVCGAASSSQTAHWQSTGAEVREEGGGSRGGMEREDGGGGMEGQIASIFILRADIWRR